MENSIKIHKIGRKKVQQECIRFLTESQTLNVYLYEGIACSHSQFHNFCFIQDGEIVGLLHTKNKSYLHIFLSARMAGSAVRKAAGFIHEHFKKFVLFGDNNSLSLIEKEGIKPVMVKRFISMEIKKPWFHPVFLYKCMTPSFKHAALLVPLQIQYEIEEVGSPCSDINRQAVLNVIKIRIERKEISAIFEGDIPVAIAGVNARFRDVCQIGSVYVVPEYRGKGYGSSLVSFHAEHLFKRYERIVLFVNEDNKTAYHIYKKAGFKDLGILLQARY